MIWKIVFILILSTNEPAEFLGSDQFDSQEKCSHALLKIMKTGAPENSVLGCIKLLDA